MSSYRNDVISAPKKGLSVNGAKVDKGKDKNSTSKSKDRIVENKDDVELYQKAMAKERDAAPKDRAIAKEVKEMAVKLASDPKNADMEIIKHPEITAS